MPRSEAILPSSGLTLLLLPLGWLPALRQWERLSTSPLKSRRKPQRMPTRRGVNESSSERFAPLVSKCSKASSRCPTTGDLFRQRETGPIDSALNHPRRCCRTIASTLQATRLGRGRQWLNCHKRSSPTLRSRLISCAISTVATALGQSLSRTTQTCGRQSISWWATVITSASLAR